MYHENVLKLVGNNRLCICNGRVLIESNEKAVVEITKGYDENAWSFKDISTQRIVSVE